MRSFEATIALDVPAAAVWQEMSDVVSWPQWMTTFTRVRALEARELALGRRFQVFQPKLRPALWTVSRLEPLVGFTWESHTPGLEMVAHHHIEAAGEGTTLRLEFGMRGLLAPPVVLLLGSLVQRYLHVECAAYATRLQDRSK